MKSKRKKIGLIGGIILTANIVVAASVIAAGASFVASNSETGYDLTLGAGDITTLTSEFNSDDFIKNTTAGNPITFHYENGKEASNKLIEIGKTEVLTYSYTTDYIGNTTPLTSVESVCVTYTSSNLWLYGSEDNVNFVKIDELSSGVSSTLCKNYRFLRFANGNKTNTSIIIDSVTFNYGCDSVNDTDEAIDITSNTIITDQSKTLSVDNSKYVEGYKSSKSLKYTNNANYYQFVISLNNSISSAKIKTMVLKFKVNTQYTEPFDTSHNYIRFVIYPAIGANRNANKSSIQTVNLDVQQSGWQDVEASFSGLLLQNQEVYDSLYIQAVYINGYINIDKMHLEAITPDPTLETLNLSYPSSGCYTWTKKDNDVNNLVVPVAGEGCESGYESYHISIGSEKKTGTDAIYFTFQNLNTDVSRCELRLKITDTSGTNISDTDVTHYSISSASGQSNTKIREFKDGTIRINVAKNDTAVFKLPVLSDNTHVISFTAVHTSSIGAVNLNLIKVQAHLA